MHAVCECVCVRVRVRVCVCVCVCLRVCITATRRDHLFHRFVCVGAPFRGAACGIFALK